MLRISLALLSCSVLEDKTKVWYVKMPEFVELERDQPSLKTPLLPYAGRRCQPE